MPKRPSRLDIPLPVSPHDTPDQIPGTPKDTLSQASTFSGGHLRHQWGMQGPRLGSERLMPSHLWALASWERPTRPSVTRPCHAHVLLAGPSAPDRMAPLPRVGHPSITNYQPITTPRTTWCGTIVAGVEPSAPGHARAWFPTEGRRGAVPETGRAISILDLSSSSGMLMHCLLSPLPVCGIIPQGAEGSSEALPLGADPVLDPGGRRVLPRGGPGVMADLHWRACYRHTVFPGLPWPPTAGWLTHQRGIRTRHLQVIPSIPVQYR